MDTGTNKVNNEKCGRGQTWRRREEAILSKQACILIPIYKPKLDKYERLSIDLVAERMSCYDIYFITYRGLDLKKYAKYKNIKVSYFPKRYFKNTTSYSRLLLNVEFYKRFLEYTYMLIVQTDALVLGEADQLESFMNQHYDYWGARWEKPVEIQCVEIRMDLKNKILKWFPFINKHLGRITKQCYVGNGGFSLRNIKKTIALLKEKRIYAALWYGNEDKFFAYHGLDNHVNYKIAPPELVDKFSVESLIRSIRDIKPFGLHGWDRIGRTWVLKYLDIIGIAHN